LLKMHKLGHTGSTKVPKLLGVIGSLREHSISAQILGWIGERSVQKGANWRLFDPRIDSLPFCDGRSDYGSYPQNVHRLRDLAEWADGFIFASAVYNGTFSAVTKNIVELLGMELLQGKVAGVVAVAAEDSAAAAVADMARLLQHSGCWIVPIFARLPFAERVLSSPDARGSQLVLREISGLADGIVSACKRWRL
jgi:NAD(P)H-dependent FMN reductase